MKDDLIFSMEDVRAVREVSTAIKDFDPYAREVQAKYKVVFHCRMSLGISSTLPCSFHTDFATMPVRAVPISA